MSLDNIYKDMTIDEKAILDELIDGNIISRIYLNNAPISNGTRYWMAVFANYLKELEKKLYITSSKYYYKQTDLNYYYPTNASSSTIGPPFSMHENEAALGIQFVDTSTGAKIYEYASELCKARPNDYKDRQSLAVSLTNDRSHKVKIIHSDNMVWVLSNNFSGDFIEKCLALMPFLFDFKRLQEDETVINVCKAVTKNEPVREFFKEIFDSLEEIRAKQKITLIKQALNERLRQQTADIERNIERTESNIRDLNNRLDDYYDSLEKLQAEHIGLLSKKGYDEEKVQEVMDFINRNRYIQDLSVKSFYSNYSGNSTNMLVLNIIAPISIYESEPLERYIEANLLDRYGEHSFKGYILKALKRVFVDEELQMVCQSYVKLDLAGMNMDASRSSQNLSYCDYTRMCQPHLTRYNCWGDNANPIKELLRAGDICNALNNILIATQNINFTDATVLNAFIDMIAESDHLYNLKTCLSKADGQLWSIKDIIDQLVREEKANEPIEKPELNDTIPEADALDAV